MVLKVTKHSDTLEDYGDDFRIERHFRSQPDGTYLWSVFRRVPTGLVLKDEFKDDPGEPLAPGGVVGYAVEKIKKPGTHPVHKSPVGLSHVWVDVFTGPENAARMRLRTLSEGDK